MVRLFTLSVCLAGLCHASIDISGNKLHAQRKDPEKTKSTRRDMQGTLATLLALQPSRPIPSGVARPRPVGARYTSTIFASGAGGETSKNPFRGFFSAFEAKTTTTTTTKASNPLQTFFDFLQPREANTEGTNSKKTSPSQSSKASLSRKSETGAVAKSDFADKLLAGPRESIEKAQQNLEQAQADAGAAIEDAKIQAKVTVEQAKAKVAVLAALPGQNLEKTKADLNRAKEELEVAQADAEIAVEKAKDDAARLVALPGEALETAKDYYAEVQEAIAASQEAAEAANEAARIRKEVMQSTVRIKAEANRQIEEAERTRVAAESRIEKAEVEAAEKIEKAEAEAKRLQDVADNKNALVDTKTARFREDTQNNLAQLQIGATNFTDKFLDTAKQVAKMAEDTAKTFESTQAQDTQPVTLSYIRSMASKQAEERKAATSLRNSNTFEPTEQMDKKVDQVEQTTSKTRIEPTEEMNMKAEQVEQIDVDPEKQEEKTEKVYAEVVGTSEGQTSEDWNSEVVAASESAMKVGEIGDGGSGASEIAQNQEQPSELSTTYISPDRQAETTSTGDIFGASELPEQGGDAPNVKTPPTIQGYSSSETDTPI